MNLFCPERLGWSDAMSAEFTAHGIDPDSDRYRNVPAYSRPGERWCGCGQHQLDRPRPQCDLRLAKGLPLREPFVSVDRVAFPPGSGPRVRRDDGHGCVERVHPSELAWERKYGFSEGGDPEW